MKLKNSDERPDNQYGVEPSRHRIKDIPTRQRPREQFDALGAEHVSDGVLLAVLLRSGVPGQSVVDMADDLLRQYGSLSALASAPVREMTKIQGMGPVKAQVLKAALELARRMSVEQIAERPTVISPHEAASVVRERTRILDKEVFWVLMLDTKNRLMEPPEEVARGILDTCLVHPREVFRTAVRIAAASVIIVHNHPSGDCTPSIEDIRMTRQLVEAGRILDIQVLDHIVVGRRTTGQEEDFISMRESGLVAF